MIEQPHFDPYSVRARISFGVAVGAALIAVAITIIYFM